MSHIEDIIREKCTNPEEAEDLVSMARSALISKRQLLRTIDEIKEGVLNG